MTKEVEVTSLWDSCKWWTLLFSKIIVVPIVLVICLPFFLIGILCQLIKEFFTELFEDFWSN